MSDGWRLPLELLLFRTANALLIRTSFNPDEYWQSIEVAHRLVFGCVYPAPAAPIAIAARRLPALHCQRWVRRRLAQGAATLAPDLLTAPSGLRRYGHLTWEWAAGIRGYVHVLPFAAVFQVG